MDLDRAVQRRRAPALRRRLRPYGAPALLLLCASLALSCGDRSVGPDETGLLALTVEENDGGLEVRAGGSRAFVAKRPFRLTLAPAGGPRIEQARGLYFVAAGARVELDALASWTVVQRRLALDVETSLGPASVEISSPADGVLRVALSPPADAHASAAGERLASPTDEAIYGLLERTVSSYRDSEAFPLEIGSLDRRGTKVDMRVLFSFGLYAPFFQTSRGYGLLVEGTTFGTYDLALSDPGSLDLEFDLPPGVTHLSYVAIGGPSHDRILDHFTALTGRPFVPPEWAFRHWRWRDEHRLGTPAMLDGVAMNADLVDDVTHYEQLGIPVGNYTFDRPWATGDLPDLTEPEEPGFGDLVWDEIRFPNSQAMLDGLNRRGYHVFLWVAPWATGVTTNREARERGYLAPGSRFIIDFTNPEAVDWWSAKIRPLIEMGLSGLKLDRGDEDTPSEASQIYSDGRSGREVHNAYPEIMSRVYHDIVKSVRGDDFLVYPRTGYTGSQRWAVFSAGDVPGKDLSGKPTDLGLRNAILAQLHCAFLGFPIWGSDTGGYEQFGDREVFARWIEFSTFSPIMEIGGVGTHAPWDMPTEPRFDQEMIDIYRRYTTLRDALVPYIYEHALAAGRSGRPIARPLVFDYQDDPRARDPVGGVPVRRRHSGRAGVAGRTAHAARLPPRR